MKQAMFCDYADDSKLGDGNKLAHFAKRIPNHMHILEKEAVVALSWLENNGMSANPKKFLAILLRQIQAN